MCFGQSPLEIYVESEFYPEHLTETYRVYQELMKGEIGPTLTLFIEDSVWGEENRLYIDTAMSLEGFRLASMVDTMPTPGTGPPRYTTQVAFRKISEYNDNLYDFYRLWVGISWNKKFEIFGRKIVFRQRPIRTKKEWSKSMWKYPAPDFLPKE